MRTSLTPTKRYFFILIFIFSEKSTKFIINFQNINQFKLKNFNLNRFNKYPLKLQTLATESPFGRVKVKTYKNMQVSCRSGIEP